MQIEGAVAVITGAAGGIGAAVALELTKRGAKALALVDLDEKVEEICLRVRSLGTTAAVPFVGDTTDPTFRRHVLTEIRQRHGVASICVPAAGITRDGLAVKIDKQTGKAEIYPLETFRLVTEINLIAPIYWALETISYIAEDRQQRGLGRWAPQEGSQGVIILIGSISAQGNKGQVSYAAAKAGLEGAAATLAQEGVFHGVRCAVIHPGFTDTPMARALGDDFLAQRVLPQTQLRRLIRPQEIADAVCFLIGNSAVSGPLWVDAGWHPSA